MEPGLVFFFLLAPVECLSFKEKYWTDLFKCILFVIFFCFLHRHLAVRISWPFQL